MPIIVLLLTMLIFSIPFIAVVFDEWDSAHKLECKPKFIISMAAITLSFLLNWLIAFGYCEKEPEKITTHKVYTTEEGNIQYIVYEGKILPTLENFGGIGSNEIEVVKDKDIYVGIWGMTEHKNLIHLKDE